MHSISVARQRWSMPVDRWALLLLPGLLFLVVVFLLPTAIMTSNSLHLSAGLGQFREGLSIENYVAFLTDFFYLEVLLDTFLLGLIVVTLCVVIGYPVAYFLARTTSGWRSTLVFLVVAPLLITNVIRNLGWLPILSNSGLVNSALLGIGIVDEPLKLVGNFTGVVIGLVHALLPFMILSLMAVIQRIEPELEEASINLGAGPLGTFWRVLLPLSRPGLLAGYLFVFTIAISAFVTPGMLGGKRVLVMATYIEQQFRSVLNYAFGATAAVILLVVAGGLTLLALRLSSKAES